MLPRSSLNDSVFGNAPAWTSNVSAIEVLISRACNPTLSEPNYALHLEVAEHINAKKANTPREASMLIARLVNHRNPHISMLALSLLETLVQSCGYPFHLQIATKEFLNELVRRFPERPPPFPGPVMTRILELIHLWKETICTESRWRDDLGNIRDMHRLLTFKGYRFREMQRQNAPSASNLKSAEELEEEDREAQSAKLQELIRRGTPRDLAAAQELMKSLAGANPDAKPDYRAQALTELNKLESKVILLNEMLDNVDVQRGERFSSGDVYDQVASLLSSARPRIQKWISDAESDDPESLDTFLQINDQINTVLNRYESFKKGDFVAAANPIPSELAASSTRNELSLIDFDDSSSAPTHNPPPADDLDSIFGPSGGVYPPPQQQSFPSNNNAFASSVSNPPTPPQLQSLSTVSQFGSIALPNTPQQYPNSQQARVGTPNYFPGGNTGMGGMAQPPRPHSQPQLQPQSQQQQQQPLRPQQQPTTPQPSAPAANPAQSQAKDPFADLVGLF